MTGENPMAVESQGWSVFTIRTVAVMAGSALMAIGGAFLTMSAFDAFYIGMVNGRGWICIALVVFASWRPGKTLLEALLFAAGVNVAFGHDYVMDPWYPLGSHNMLEVAHMGAHCLQMMRVAQMATLYSMITSRGAEVMQHADYGIAVGKPADLVILQARSPMEAIRLKPARLAVFRRGKCITHTPEVAATVELDGRESPVSFLPSLCV
jgi:hypothetical protein